MEISALDCLLRGNTATWLEVLVLYYQVPSKWLLISQDMGGRSLQAQDNLRPVFPEVFISFIYGVYIVSWL